MKFQRTDLIVRVKAAIAAKHQAAAARNAKAAAYFATSREEYLAKTGPGWKQLADTIRIRLRTGQPMTAKDIPREVSNGRGHGGGYVATWDATEPDEYVPDTAALEQLLVLLEAATDDEITTSSLERMGFRTAQLFTTR